MWLDDLAGAAIDSADRPPSRQLSDILRAAIADGSMLPGSEVPTEAELQGAFGTSRSVVREALASLTDEGLIQRGRGRGWVVTPHRQYHRRVQRMPGLAAQIAPTSGPVSTEVLSISEGTDGRAANALGTSELLSLRRRRSVQGEAIVVSQTWLPLALAGSLRAEDLTDSSLYTFLRTRFGVPVTAGRRSVRAVPASMRLAGELSIAPGSPLLLLEGTSVDDRGMAVEYFSTWHRADRVVFDVDAVADDGPDVFAAFSPTAVGKWAPRPEGERELLPDNR